MAQTATVRLLTPDGWHERRTGQRWPVMYLLHGVEGTHEDWTVETGITGWAELRHVLVVMPDADTGFYSDWWNEGAGGPPQWETFHLDEVRPLLERHHAASARRVVAGLSMGGLGALLYGARRPGMFRAAASYSGPVHYLHPRAIELWRQVFEVAPHLLNMWGDPAEQRAIWEAHDPYYLAGRLRNMRLYLSCGTGNPGTLDPIGTPIDESEQFVHLLNQSLVERLAPISAGGRVSAELTTHFYDGTHSWPYWERELRNSLPLLLPALWPK